MWFCDYLLYNRDYIILFRWTVKKLSPTKCAIVGEEVTDYDANQWNCALQSLPIEDFHDKYESFQEFFSIKLIEPIEIDENQFDESYEIIEGNEKDFSVQVSNARVKKELF